MERFVAHKPIMRPGWANRISGGVGEDDVGEGAQTPEKTFDGDAFIDTVEEVAKGDLRGELEGGEAVALDAEPVVKLGIGKAGDHVGDGDAGGVAFFDGATDEVKEVGVVIFERRGGLGLEDFEFGAIADDLTDLTQEVLGALTRQDTAIEDGGGFARYDVAGAVFTGLYDGDGDGVVHIGA